MTKPIHIINGPNLNMLGVREPDIYGRLTLADIEAACAERGKRHGLGVLCVQSNIEGELVDAIQQVRSTASGLIINAGAYTHTSVALYDALKLLEVPIMEVHISNPGARESFRHQSFITPVAKGVIAGLGLDSYLLAIDALAGL